MTQVNTGLSFISLYKQNVYPRKILLSNAFVLAVQHENSEKTGGQGQDYGGGMGKDRKMKRVHTPEAPTE